MSSIANETIKNVFKILGYNIESDKKSRKRPAKEEHIHHSQKYRKLGGIASGSLLANIFDEPRSYSFSSAEKQSNFKEFGAGLYDNIPRLSGFKSMANQYADIEFSDNEENDDFISGKNKSKFPMNNVNGSEKQIQTKSIQQQEPQLTNGHGKVQEKKSFFSQFKSSPPPMFPLRRGNLMLNSLPRLNPINKTRPTNNFGSVINSTANQSTGNLSNLVNGGFIKSDSFTFNPPKKNSGLNLNNSIITSTLRVDERNKYYDLLKRCAPTVYQPGEQNQTDKRNVTSSSSPKYRIPKILSEIIAVDDDEDDEVVEVPLNNHRASPKSDTSSIFSEKHKFEVQPVNSLKNKFDLKPEFQEEWLKNITNKYSMKNEQRQAVIKEHKESIQSLEANTRTSELAIQKKLQEFVISPEIVIIDDSEPEEEEDVLPELTEEHRRYIHSVTVAGPAHAVIIEKFNLQIKRMDLRTLLGNTWLNDEVINFYMNLLMERSDLRKKDGFPSVYAMNTFFMPKLLSNGHSSVRRWTRKVDIFSFDIIPVPVHVGQVHWCMAIIHLKNKTIRYYDSMGSPNNNVLRALENYLREESLDKKSVPFDTSNFKIENVSDCPRQLNGSDCGVFSCMFAEYITRNREITFSQEHMPYFREKMIFEIATGKLLL